MFLTFLTITARSLKAGWIKRYLDKNNNGIWKTMFKNKQQKVGDTLILESNINEFDMHRLLKNHKFTTDIFLHGQTLMLF